MNKKTSKASLFLIELVLSIFFFIIATVICLQLFINTHLLSKQSIETNQAVLWSQNLAEPFLGNHGDFSIVKKLYFSNDCIQDFSFATNSQILLCFDEKWNPVNSISNADYLVYSYSYADDSFTYEDIYIAKISEKFTNTLSKSDFLALISSEQAHIYNLTIKKAT